MSVETVEKVAREIPDAAVKVALKIWHEKWTVAVEDDPPSTTGEAVWAEQKAMRAAIEAAFAAMGEREPVGLFATLTPEQQEAALAYQGPEDLMPSHPKEKDRLSHDEKMEIARKIMRRDHNILKELAD